MSCWARVLSEGVIEPDLRVFRNNVAGIEINVGEIRAKIGAGAPINAVFVGRRPTGEVYTASLGAAQPERDWVLTRILWLSGLEPGINRLGDVDSMRRYIYIHGTPYETDLGVPASHGCVRMSNRDVCALFDRVAVGTLVTINDD